MKKLMLPALAFSLIFASCKKQEMKKDIKAPVAEKQPTKLEKHGDVRTDDYFWMRLTDEQKNA